MIRFPKDFIFGAATSSYQVEGNNRKADWWHWERTAGKERSGRACGHYQLYEQDFDLAKRLHHKAHRLSIEWSRIEPERGKFSESALKHYIHVILALRERNIEPVVTLHHFTNPFWFSRFGGWTNPLSIRRFLKFVDYVVPALAPHVRYWITINEPTVYVSHAFLFGIWPPQSKSVIKAAAVGEHIVQAHVHSYQLIHHIYKVMSLPNPMISIAQNMMAYVPCRATVKNRMASFLRDKVYNGYFLKRANIHNALDFIGLNYYSRQLVALRSVPFCNVAMDVCHHGHHRVKKNALGWDIYPKGLYQILMNLKGYRMPVLITENGICTENDELRWEYISKHLKYIHKAIRHGVDVFGYLYWSLMDNFEWDKGYGPRFGLIEVDYKTMKRKVRRSARRYGKVCKTGELKG